MSLRLQWEYKIVSATFGDKLEAELNRYGLAGWEVVSITGMNGTVTLTGNRFTALMKRPVESYDEQGQVHHASAPSALGAAGEYATMRAAHPEVFNDVLTAVTSRVEQGHRVDVTMFDSACRRVENGESASDAIWRELMANGQL